MEKEESKVAKAIREGVTKAYEKGENLVTVVGEVTKEAIKKALEGTQPTREKVEEIAKEAMKGVIQGGKTAQVETEVFVKEAAEGIIEGIKQSGAKAAEFAKHAAEATLEASKEAGEKAAEAVKDTVKGLTKVGVTPEKIEEPLEKTMVDLPRLGSPAPQFEAVTTHGKIKLKDFKGKWLVLFSHPADFTPVCTTELIAFAQIHPKLREMNCELIGLSIDSVYSHVAWVRNIEEKLGQKITFPVIADLNKEVATLYGMIMPGESKTETSRCVFVIDDKQVLRAMIYYPLTTGRNMDEILRLIQALQTTDKHEVATPANWRPGDKVIVPPPTTQEMAEERVKDQNLECKDWYFSQKELK